MRAIAPGLLLIVSLLWVVGPAAAQEEESFLCIEAATGRVVSEHNAGVVRPPASMVKMMLMLLVSEGLDAGRWTADQEVEVSALAQRTGGSQVYLRAGATFTLDQLMRAVAVASANDAAVAVAEGLWGSVEAAVAAMNARAAELGMKDTTYITVNGLPQGDDTDLSTAYDTALLARRCVSHPRLLKWTSLRRLTGGNGLPPRDNTNDLVGVYAGCDGLKTGTTLAAGYCLAATARRDGLRLIAVVMNNASKAGRFRRARELFDAGFQRVIQRVAVERGQMLAPEIPVVNGRGRHVRLCALEDLEVTIDRDDVPKLEIVVEHPEWLRAPVKAGEEQGRVLVRLEDEVLAAGRAAIATDVREADWRWKLEHSAFGGLGYAALRPGEEGDPETSKQLGVEGLAVPLAR